MVQGEGLIEGSIQPREMSVVQMRETKERSTVYAHRREIIVVLR